MRAMSKLHNLVIHICAFVSCMTEFVESAGWRIPLDNCTRWNSWYHMLQIAQKQAIKEILVLYIEKYRDTNTIDKKDILNSEDWNQLCMISSHLTIFERAILHLQENCMTLERVSESLEIIH